MRCTKYTIRRQCKTVPCHAQITRIVCVSNRRGMQTSPPKSTPRSSFSNLMKIVPGPRIMRLFVGCLVFSGSSLTVEVMRWAARETAPCLLSFLLNHVHALACILQKSSCGSALWLASLILKGSIGVSLTIPAYLPSLRTQIYRRPSLAKHSYTRSRGELISSATGALNNVSRAYRFTPR